MVSILCDPISAHMSVKGGDLDPEERRTDGLAEIGCCDHWPIICDHIMVAPNDKIEPRAHIREEPIKERCHAVKAWGRVLVKVTAGPPLSVYLLRECDLELTRLSCDQHDLSSPARALKTSTHLNPPAPRWLRKGELSKAIDKDTISGLILKTKAGTDRCPSGVGDAYIQRARESMRELDQGGTRALKFYLFTISYPALKAGLVTSIWEHSAAFTFRVET